MGNVNPTQRRSLTFSKPHHLMGGAEVASPPPGLLCQGSRKQPDPKDPGVRWVNAFLSIRRSAIPPPAEMARLQRTYGMYMDGKNPYPCDSDSQGPQTHPRVPTVNMIRRDPSIGRRMGDEAEHPNRGPGPLGPLLMNILGSQPPPEFSGNMADWERFSQEWAFYESVLQQTQPAGFPDGILLIIFRRSLDETSRQKLDAAMRLNPRLTFTQFWDTLVTEFARDPSAYHRKEWLKVSLNKKSELNPQTWRTFRCAFELALSRVEDATEREVEERLLGELPPYWRDRIIMESADRARGTYWVRVLKPAPVQGAELEAVLAQILLRDQITMKERRLEYWVDCGSAEGQRLMMQGDGWNPFGNCTLNVRPTTRKMDHQEIFEWVEEQLQMCQSLSRSYGTNVGVRAI